MRHSMEEPKESKPFQGPSERDPLALKLERKNQTNEKQERPTLPGKPRIAARGIGPVKFQQRPHADCARENKDGRQQPHPFVREGERDGAVDEPELENLRERTDRPRPRLLLLARSRMERRRRRSERVRSKRAWGSPVRSRTARPARSFHQARAKQCGERKPVRALHNRGSQQNPGENESDDENRSRIPEPTPARSKGARSRNGVTVPAAVKGRTPGRQADAGTVAACRSAKITIAVSAALSGAWWANNPIHSATRMNVRPPAPSAIPRCARPITGKASKPASARKTKPKKKSGWRASVGMAESQKRKSQSRDPGDNGGSSSPAFCGLLLRSCFGCLASRCFASSLAQPDRSKKEESRERAPQNRGRSRRRDHLSSRRKIARPSRVESGPSRRPRAEPDNASACAVRPPPPPDRATRCRERARARCPLRSAAAPG